jgi:hypothetical protein
LSGRRGVGGCGGGAGGGVALRRGPAPAMDPFPVPRRRSVFEFLQAPGLPLLGLTRGCLRASPGDAHALWQRVVGVLRAMTVADCVQVSGSVGSL